MAFLMNNKIEESTLISPPFSLLTDEVKAGLGMSKKINLSISSFVEK